MIRGFSVMSLYAADARTTGLLRLVQLLHRRKAQ
jgi:hypothetical protein